MATPADKRITLLEEALAECLDWIRDSDIYDDNLAVETSWIRDGRIVARPPLPGEYSDLESLQACITEVQTLVQRVESLLSGDELEAARARAQTRRRLESRLIPVARARRQRERVIGADATVGGAASAVVSWGATSGTSVRRAIRGLVNPDMAHRRTSTVGGTSSTVQ